MIETKKCLLVVEDDTGLQSQLRWCFEGFEVVLAGDREEALAQTRRYQPSVVTLDLGLPPDPGGVSEGIATLEEILAIAPLTKVIVVTGNDQHANAVNTIGLGAYDFYEKPIDPHILGMVVDRAHRLYELEMENRRLQQASTRSPLQGIIANSPQIMKICRDVEKVAPSDVTVLLLGESGTGKELFAQAIHQLSACAEKKMVAINCAAIPETLLESELFGYEKGAFTGAVKQNKGKIEYANGSTLFLDEIADMPQGLQSKLLRFLQERVIERVGGRQEIPVDVRIICATHQKLEELVAAGSFRHDLYFRISELTINIPPLREREGDAVLLARTFLEKYNQEFGRSIRGYTGEAVTAIEKFGWPGNVRELESRVKRAVIMADGQTITTKDLEIKESEQDTLPINLKQAREDAERRAIQRVLGQTGINMTKAAKLLGVTRPTLYGLMDKYRMKL